MRENNPRVSIIIPTYNRAYLLGRAIKSVLKQTYQDFEIIVVDDGSTDNTEEVVKGFNKEKVKYIKYKVNRGGNAARNTGLKNAYGKLIAFLDSDDEYLPEKLEKQLKVFENSNDSKLGFVYCGAILRDKNGEFAKVLPEVKGDIFREVLKNNCITGGGSSPLIRRKVFKKCGLFDESEYLKKGGAQEYEMWIRIAKYYHFDFVNDCLIKYYYHFNSITGSSKYKDKAKAYEYIVNKFIEDYKKVSGTLSYNLSVVAGFYCCGKKTKKGRKLFLESIKVNPFNFRSYFYLLLSFLGLKFYQKIYSFILKYLGNKATRLANRAVLE